MAFVIYKIEARVLCFVAPQGLARSYTRSKADAKRYSTFEAAEADRCGNEKIMRVDI